MGDVPAKLLTHLAQIALARMIQSTDHCTQVSAMHLTFTGVFQMYRSHSDRRSALRLAHHARHITSAVTAASGALLPATRRHDFATWSVALVGLDIDVARYVDDMSAEWQRLFHEHIAGDLRQVCTQKAE